MQLGECMLIMQYSSVRTALHPNGFCNSLILLSAYGPSILFVPYAKFRIPAGYSVTIISSSNSQSIRAYLKQHVQFVFTVVRQRQYSEVINNIPSS